MQTLWNNIRPSGSNGVGASPPMACSRPSTPSDACAVACAVIDTIEKDNLLASATDVGGYFQSQLRDLAKRHSAIVDVRGIGLMIGVEFDTHEHSAAVEWAAFQRGLLTLECGHSVIRMAPPLVLTEAEAEVGLEIFGAAVAEVAAIA